MNKIYIVDSITGSGKTTAAINKIKNDTENNYLYITPFLDEVKRIIDSCKNKNFMQPLYKGKGGKLDNIHYLIGNNKNIVSTHALFQMFNNYTKELLKEKNYILILDEVCDVVDLVNISNDDLKVILKDFAHIEDGLLVWDKDDYNGKFNDIKLMAENKSLVVYKDAVLLWNFPIEFFKLFKEAYILTYMFNAQIQKYYYDYYNIKYNYIGVQKKISNNKYTYVFAEENTLPEYVKELKYKINILDDEKLNSIGESDDNKQPLCSSWFDRELILPPNERFLINKLKNNLYNYFTNKVKSSSKEAMWTTYKDAKSHLSGKGYTKGFIAVNARATNQYRHKTNLAYCANIFLNPVVKQFFQQKSIKVYEDQYALSELIQWVWRSAIRDEKPINLYIPSKRMRNLLIEWIDSF